MAVGLVNGPPILSWLGRVEKVSRGMKIVVPDLRSLIAIIMNSLGRLGRISEKSIRSSLMMKRRAPDIERASNWRPCRWAPWWATAVPVMDMIPSKMTRASKWAGLIGTRSLFTHGHWSRFLVPLIRYKYTPAYQINALSDHEITIIILMMYKNWTHGNQEFKEEEEELSSGTSKGKRVASRGNRPERDRWIDRLSFQVALARARAQKQARAQAERLTNKQATLMVL